MTDRFWSPTRILVIVVGGRSRSSFSRTIIVVIRSVFVGVSLFPFHGSHVSSTTSSTSSTASSADATAMTTTASTAPSAASRSRRVRVIRVVGIGFGITIVFSSRCGGGGSGGGGGHRTCWGHGWDVPFGAPSGQGCGRVSG